MDYVVDFSGLYIEGHFIVRELAVCRISQHGIEVQKVKTSVFDFGNSVRLLPSVAEFYDRCGIDVSVGDVTISEMQSELYSIFSSLEFVYVRDQEKLEKLTSFLPSIPRKFKFLTDLGFDGPEVFVTDCWYHSDATANYCARTNVEQMAKWLLEAKYRRLSAVVDLTGYETLEGVFRVKELSARLLDANGDVFDSILLVTVAPKPEHTRDLVRAYEKTFFQMFGIHWSIGNFSLTELAKAVKIFLSRKEIAVIFVRNREIASVLMGFLASDVGSKVMSINDLGFALQSRLGAAFPPCEFHENPDAKRNFCAGASTSQMLGWIREMQMFKMEVLGTVRRFRQMSSEVQAANDSGVAFGGSEDSWLDDFEV